MKRILLLSLALALTPALAQTTTTNYVSEVLITTSPTEIPTLPGRKALELQNLGPNPIFCAMKTANTVLNKARRIASGDAWATDLTSTVAVYCITTANQVTGAGTIATQVP